MLSSNLASRVPPGTDTGLATALASAAVCADRTELPQTVYRNETSGGWWHTNALAPVLARSELSQTVLPGTYFR